MKPLQNNSNFETSDLSLAAYLKANNVPLISTRKLDNKVYFQFNDPKVQEIAMLYFNDGKVKASSYSRAISELKTLIYQGRSLKGGY